MPPTTTTGTAHMIRRELKARLGVTSRQVSVRDTGGSTHTSVNVRVKSHEVSLAAVAAIADPYNDASRRIFVTAEYTPEAMKAGGRAYLARVGAALASLEGNPRDNSAPIGMTGLSLRYPVGSLDVELWSHRCERRIWQGCSAEEIAGQVFLVLDRLQGHQDATETLDESEANPTEKSSQEPAQVSRIAGLPGGEIAAVLREILEADGSRIAPDLRQRAWAALGRK